MMGMNGQNIQKVVKLGTGVTKKLENGLDTNAIVKIKQFVTALLD